MSTATAPFPSYSPPPAPLPPRPPRVVVWRRDTVVFWAAMLVVLTTAVAYSAGYVAAAGPAYEVGLQDGLDVQLEVNPPGGCEEGNETPTDGDGEDAVLLVA